MCANNNCGNCGLNLCGNNLWWILLLVLLFCFCGNAGTCGCCGCGGCENNGGCGCC